MDTTSVLSLITGSTPNDGLDVRLLASPIVMGTPLSPDDLDEVSFDGYEALRPSQWNDLAPAGEDGISIASPALRLQRLSGEGECRIVAYAVTADTADGRRLVAAANLGVPMALDSAGDAVRFRVGITVFVVQPVNEGDDTKEIVSSLFEQLPSRS